MRTKPNARCWLLIYETRSHALQRPSIDTTIVLLSYGPNSTVLQHEDTLHYSGCSYPKPYLLNMFNNPILVTFSRYQASRVET